MYFSSIVWVLPAQTAVQSGLGIMECIHTLVHQERDAVKRIVSNDEYRMPEIGIKYDEEKLLKI